MIHRMLNAYRTERRERREEGAFDPRIDFALICVMLRAAR